MNQPKTGRIASLDLLKGLVMIIMALDHTRDYFHDASFLFEPTDPDKTNLALFITRWVTHFCAPAFSLLAGVSAYLVGRRKSKKELSSFLLKRGLWLIFIEFSIVTFGWQFDIHFKAIGFLVIWSLGISMVFLAALIHLKLKHILVFSLLMIFGHNILDTMNLDQNFFWSIIHQRGYFNLTDSIRIRVVYPIIPWIGVMSLGYYFGSFYNTSIAAGKRQQLFNSIGVSAIGLFIIIRLINQYGNPNPWVSYDTFIQTLFSFLDPSKYPPSLTYLLMTLGPTMLFLGCSENIKGRVPNFIGVFGKVPFFYYIVHIYVIHTFALILAQLTGYGWQSMVLSGFVSNTAALVGYGVNLWFVYAIWIGIIFLLYPMCRKFSVYKLTHKEKWWLSYF